MSVTTSVLPADEVLRRFVGMHDSVPEALRDFSGVSYLVQDLAFVRSLLAGRPPTTPRVPVRR